ncbi:MAG: DegT/DnrJ/EryC1/StrS family aminotransferase, partial [Gammaproteobacteria bacterium]
NNPLLTLPSKGESGQHVWHLFVIRSAWRDALQQHLTSSGIQTLIHYPIPPHKQPALSAFNHFQYPLTEQLHQDILSLPLNPSMTIDDAEKVITACNTFDPGSGKHRHLERKERSPNEKAGPQDD